MTQVITNPSSPPHLPKLSPNQSSSNKGSNSSSTKNKNKIPSKYETKWVYAFSAGNAEGDGSMKSLLGGKGAGLATMSKLALPVPAGFTITTAVCRYFNEKNEAYPKELKAQVEEKIKELEELSGNKFGDEHKPLLVSVRSGSCISMPGMMDTILNLGLNDKTIVGLENLTKNKKFTLDTYRRFIQMFSNVVMNIDINKFEYILNNYKTKYNYKNDIDLSCDHLLQLINEYKVLFKNETGIDFIQDIHLQLWYSINAVFKSWNNNRAIVYRKLHNIANSLGTAVTVQSMVFGNMGNSSATGVVFTRNPSDGKNEFYGEYLINAQGEDVVAGIRTPHDINNLKNDNDEFKKLYIDLKVNCNKLENYFKDVQDIEFTIQQNKLYILQTRNAKRSAKASVKIAIDMVNENIITKDQALLRINPNMLSQLLHPTIDPSDKKDILTKGLPASPGAAYGMLCLSTSKCIELSNLGNNCILCTEETSPEDINGMVVSKGILTKRGGMTSHAAVVARGIGTPAVTGANEITINCKKKIITVNNNIHLKEGDVITIDGATGEIMNGKMRTINPEISDDFQTIMDWADERKKLTIVANAETPNDVLRARKFGAKGIGLCRTEHMFFDPDRINIMREMILANNNDSRKKALDKLLPFQIHDFEQIIKIMSGYPVTVRYLDPPLHEFLPETETDINNIARSSGISKEEITKKVKSMKENNPMLGLRGCRVGILYPEIYLMQTKAIMKAAINVAKEIKNQKIHIELMVPFISIEEEIKILKLQIDELVHDLLKEDVHNIIKYKIGTMIELPRAALKADDIAKHAEFFSFGTNDLTQTCFGLSRDDSNSFMTHYENLEIVKKDPFVALDTDGVGELIKIAVERGTRTRKDLKLCLCGEQGGHPDSVKFCHKVGLHSVSCSPFLVPVARLAAAHAAILDK